MYHFRQQLDERTRQVSSAVDASREQEADNADRAARAERLKELKKELNCGASAKTCQTCERAQLPCKPWCCGKQNDQHIRECKNQHGCYDEHGILHSQVKVLLQQSKTNGKQ